MLHLDEIFIDHASPREVQTLQRATTSYKSNWDKLPCVIMWSSHSPLCNVGSWAVSCKKLQWKTLNMGRRVALGFFTKFLSWPSDEVIFCSRWLNIFVTDCSLKVLENNSAQFHTVSMIPGHFADALGQLADTTGQLSDVNFPTLVLLLDLLHLKRCLCPLWKRN